jgi:glyoxylase I family protein
MKATGIDHVVLRVRDLERAVGFYRDILGCLVDRRRDDLGMVHLRAGPSLIDLVAVDGPLGRGGGPAPGPTGHNMDHLCLRVADFDADEIRAHLVRHGVTIGEIGARYGSTGDGQSLYLEDPDGNRLELRG